MQKIWKINKPAPREFLEKFPEFQKITLQMLWDRGIKTQKAIDEFFSPDYDQDLHDPFLFKDMEKAVKRIEQAAKSREKVAIFADYDADGICGAVLLYEILEIYHIKPEVYIPDRNTEGYGLNLKAVEQIFKKGVKLILTTDCGITDIEEVKLANKLGMDVIIVDHHEIPAPAKGKPKLPDAFAIINPKQKGCKYPFKELAGAGVAFKLLQAIRITKNLPIAWEKWLLDLVAIATITDSMSILGENRTLVKYGLIVLSQTRRLGLKTLIEKARIKGDLDVYTIGFILGPRINAASRVDHGTVALRLLLSKDRTEADKLANGLESKNQERQKQMERIFKEARSRAIKTLDNKKIIFEADESWISGIIGLIAQKLRDEFWRPTFICQLSKDHLVCSGRGGVAGFNVIKVLDKCKELLGEYGGHPFAGAFRANIGDSEKIQKILEETANQEIKAEDMTPFLDIDTEIDASEVNWKVFEEIERFQPFGSGNRAPLFAMRGLKVIGIKNVGSKENHLKLFLEKEIKTGIKKFGAIGFNLVNSCAKIELGDKIDIVFEILANEWNGNKELQLKIVDLKKI